MMNAGGAIGAIVNLGASFMKSKGLSQIAAEYKEKARENERLSQVLPRRAMQKEYSDALVQAQLMSQSGMPGYESNKADIDSNAANVIRTMQETNPFGATIAPAIAQYYGKVNKDLTQPGAEQSAFRRSGEQVALGELKNVASQKEELSKEQLIQKEKLKSMADKLMQAYYSYKTGALNETTQGMKSFGSSVGSMGIGGGGGGEGGAGGM